MNININVSDYLSEDEIKIICKDAVTDAVHDLLRKESDVQRFLSNSAYHFVFDAVDELYPGNAQEKIATKVIEIIDDMSSYCVFRNHSTYDGESLGMKMINQTLKNETQRIENRVRELIGAVDLRMIQDVLNEQIENAIESLKHHNTEER